MAKTVEPRNERMTIEELEAVLERPGLKANIEPDGSVTVEAFEADPMPLTYRNYIPSTY